MVHVQLCDSVTCPVQFSCKKGPASGSNIIKKIIWWIIFVIITKSITKTCSKDLFCNKFGQDGTMEKENASSQAI